MTSARSGGGKTRELPVSCYATRQQFTEGVKTGMVEQST